MKYRKTTEEELALILEQGAQVMVEIFDDRVEIYNRGACPRASHKITTQVTRLLEVLQGEMTRGEIMKKLGLKDRVHFRKKYLLRAMESGHIEMTIPEKPNSHLQKYRLTNKGLKIIGGDD